jgi:hypothetical protein
VELFVHKYYAADNPIIVLDKREVQLKIKWNIHSVIAEEIIWYNM